MCGAIITSPFDVVKTRLQSDLFREKHANIGLVAEGASGSAVLVSRRPGGLLYNFVETGYILKYVRDDCLRLSEISSPITFLEIYIRTSLRAPYSKGWVRLSSELSLLVQSTSSRTETANK